MTKPSKTSRAHRLEAFEAVVRHYESALLRYAARVLNDPDGAQDVVQDSFIRLLHRWKGEMEPSGQMTNWLYRVAHNCAVDHVRKIARRSLLHRRVAEEREQTVAPDRGQEFRVSDQAARAAAALQTLDLRERQLVVLKVYEEKSYKEIGAITGLSTGNVGYILHHAMRKLARALEGDTSS
ncbi:MAG: sigma-70 family RNA polymerase sigma factor [Kiritimatiellae bacterium]|nr:sigma-70 family RNA polymerase sigma factor [Kiritimatiellia bacterium]